MGNLKAFVVIVLPALEAGTIATLITVFGGNIVFLAAWLIIIAAILGSKWAIMVIRELPLEPCLVNIQPRTIREGLEWLNGSAGTMILITESWIGTLFGLWALLLFP